MIILGCVKPMKGDGFFAADIPVPEGSARKQQAIDAWNKGKAALNDYIETANTGLMLELNQLNTI